MKKITFTILILISLWFILNPFKKIFINQEKTTNAIAQEVNSMLKSEITYPKETIEKKFNCSIEEIDISNINTEDWNQEIIFENNKNHLITQKG